MKRRNERGEKRIRVNAKDIITLLKMNGGKLDIFYSKCNLSYRAGHPSKFGWGLLRE